MAIIGDAMKKSIITAVLAALAGASFGQLAEEVSIERPSIVRFELQRNGLISFNPRESRYEIGIDAALSDGSLVPADFLPSPALSDVIAALSEADPSVDWGEALALVNETVFLLAVSDAPPGVIASQLDTPALMPRGIEVPVVVLQSETNNYGIGLIAADDGTILTYLDHQSPRPSAEEIEARRAAKLAEHAARKEAFISGTGSGHLQDRINNLEAAVRSLLGN